MKVEKPEAEKNFIEKPITLHPELVLTNEDIERELKEEEIPRETIRIMQKRGFPGYHLNPNTRVLLMFGMEHMGHNFLLKEDSPLIEKFIERYENNFG